MSIGDGDIVLVDVVSWKSGEKLSEVVEWEPMTANLTHHVRHDDHQSWSRFLRDVAHAGGSGSGHLILWNKNMNDRKTGRQQSQEQSNMTSDGYFASNTLLFQSHWLYHLSILTILQPLVHSLKLSSGPDPGAQVKLFGCASWQLAGLATPSMRRL